MKIVVQKVIESKVEYESKIITEIKSGFVFYVGVEKEEPIESIDWFLKQIDDLNPLPEDEFLILSQFTLMAEFKGNKPSFHKAESHYTAEIYFKALIEKAKEKYGKKVKNGIFGKKLEIYLEFEVPNAKLLSNTV